MYWMNHKFWRMRTGRIVGRSAAFLTGQARRASTLVNVFSKLTEKPRVPSLIGDQGRSIFLSPPGWHRTNRAFDERRHRDNDSRMKYLEKVSDSQHGAVQSLDYHW